ncbi:MaoC like domain-containing protein [Solimonas aquatica]|uniref:MaoC like domain-containing protein n=1 Tax=Solimonas aquatica TaxID=489703 RepID=A0A1H9HFJ6_9GAMM|nr:MaoC/PaaZ C-terminal domain-containing protein [Solimonas aquatica]SEQ61068.1 MaoC like domain-containing protein [Solimonas aquatica]
MNATLAQLPSAEGLFLKAAATALRRPKGKLQLPQLSVQVRDVAVSATQLAEYREVCGFAAGEQLPITFPHVMAAGLHMHLMVQRQFPLPLLGLVHLRNHISQRRGLGADERFDFDVRLGESRQVRQGLEFDVLSEVSVAGELVWQETMTILHRMPGPKGPAPRSTPPPARLAEYLSVDAPADLGRRYARVGKDFNPIHLTPWSAKLFGFKRHIAHGMWTMAHCAALLEGQLPAPPRELETQFRQPLFLPGRAALKYSRAADPAQGIEFSLLARNSDKVHLSGVLR